MVRLNLSSDRLRRPNHMRSHLDELQTTTSVDLRRVPGNFHSVAKQASFPVALWSDFSRFWSDFDKFWEAEMDAIIGFWEIFWRCFFRMRSGIDFGSFFRGSNLEKSLKTIGFSMVFVIFQKIDVFEKVSKKHGFWGGFRRPKP